MDEATAWKMKVGITLSRKLRLGLPVLLVLGCFACAGVVSAAPFPATQCAADRFGSDLGCTAQDVQITGMSVVGDTTSCIGGDPVTLDLQMTVNFGNPKRYDIGIFISTDGNDPQTTSANGGAATCAVSVLPTASPFLDLDGGTGDTCGDGDGTIGGGSGSGIHYMPNVTVPCQSLAGGGGNLYIPFVVSWDQNAGTLCQSSLDAVPGGTAKCNSPTIAQGSVAVVVLPTLSNSDGIATISSGGTTDYAIAIANTTGVALNNVVLTDPAVSGIAANTLTCAAAGGATCPAGATVAALQGAGITLPSMPAGGSLTFTLNATLTGNPSDTRTNTATVAVGGQSNAAGDTDTIVDVIAILPPTLARSGAAGAAVVYTYAVHNFGASTDTIDLSAVSSLGWSVGLSSASVSVAAGGSANITVTVDIPLGAPLGTVDSTLITATSGNDPGLTATATAVTTVAAVLTLVPSDTGTGSAGSSAYYNHRVQNNASTAKTVSLTQSFTAGSCAGWTGALFEIDQTTSLPTPVALAAYGGFKDFVLKVSIPFGATVASTCTAEVTAAFTSGAPNAVSVTDTTTVKNLLLYEDPGYTTAQDTYPVGNSVYGKVFGLATGTAYYYKWLDPDGTTRRTSPITSGLVSLPDTYTIPGAGPLGTWTVQIWNDTTNTIFEQTDFYVGPDHLAATFAGGIQATNTDVVVDLALHDKIDHVEPFDGSGGLVKGNPADPEGPLMITVTVSGSAAIVGTTLLNATITGQTVTGKLDGTTGTATLTIRDAVPETVTVTPASYKSVLIGSPDRDESAAVSFIYVASIDHFVIGHDQFGINCLAEPVRVTAVTSAGATVTDYTGSIVLNTQSADGTWTLAAGSGSFSDPTPNDGLATYTFAPADVGTALFTLAYPEGTTPLNIAVSAGAIVDNDAEGTLSFTPSGFTVTSSLLSNPPPAAIPAFATQTAGSAFTTYLTAYGQTATDPVCGVIEAYAGARTLRFWTTYNNPAYAGPAAPVSPTVTAGASTLAADKFEDQTATDLAVTFVNGQASVAVKYKDVGQIGLNLKDIATAVDPVALPTGIRGGSSLFVVKPAGFTLSAIQRTADSFANPAAADENGAAFIRAGDPFSVTVSAVDGEGTVTPSYGQEAPAESVSLGSTLVAPVAGNNPALSNPTAFGAFAAGVATGTTFAWGEVGLITLTPTVADTDYLGVGQVTGSSSGNVGRFIPHHFRLTGAAALTNRSELACAPASAFTYMDEPLTVQFVLEAQNAADVLTANYTGVYAKLDPTTAAPFGFGAVSPGPPVTPLTARLDLGLAPTGAWLNGAGDFTVTMALTRGAAPDGPFDDLAVGMAPTDPDAVAYRAADLDLDTDGDTIAERIRLATTQARFGRLALQNAYGSELLPLTVPFAAEFFDGTGFITNSADSCTSLPLGQLHLSSVADPGPSNPIQVNPSFPNLTSATPPTPFSAGIAGLTLSAPGAGGDGYVDLSADLSSAAWLRFDWDGNGSQDDPKARASFGIYKGNPRLIYLRERVP